MVVRNWLFGWYISEFERAGSSRKEFYGKALMPKLAKQLTDKPGKGFSRRSLDQLTMRMEQKTETETLFAIRWKVR